MTDQPGLPDGELTWKLALKRLAYLIDRSGRHEGVPFSEEFIRSTRFGELFGGAAGRGADVRLKLYLTLTLLVVGKDHSVKETPSSSWAEALGLPDPDGKGARQVAAALNWLADHKYVSLTRAPGRPHVVRLLDPMGTKKAYSRPNRGGSRYVRVPLDVWRNGWIVALSGRALAGLIIILDRLGTKHDSCWIPPEERSTAIGISDATWTRALRELGQERHRLVTVSREPVGRSQDFDWSRLRNRYRVDRERLKKEPDERGAGGFDARRSSKSSA